MFGLKTAVSLATIGCVAFARDSKNDGNTPAVPTHRPFDPRRRFNLSPKGDRASIALQQFNENKDSQISGRKLVEHDCQYIIDRAESGPEDYASIIGSGSSYSDASMFEDEMVQWEDYPNSYGDLSSLITATSSYGHLFDLIDDNNIWGDDHIKFSDVAQGYYIGDCWLLASCSGVALKRKDIADVFATKTANDEGIIALNLYLKGRETQITIDDTVPLNSYGSPTIAQLEDSGAIWPLIIEKGLAKLYGNLENIVGGWTHEANYALTGYPSTYMTIDEFTDAEDMFNYFEEALKRGDILSLGTYGNGDDSVTNSYGLVMSHAYTVIDTVRLTTDNEEVHRLIKMRNPWGSEYYDGAWCDDCSEWTDDFKDKAGFYNANDGEIFIEDVDLYASDD